MNGLDAWVENRAAAASRSRRSATRRTCCSPDGATRIDVVHAPIRGRVGPSHSPTARRSSTRSVVPARPPPGRRSRWRLDAADGDPATLRCAVPVRPRLSRAPPRERAFRFDADARRRRASRGGPTRRAAGHGARERRLRARARVVPHFLYEEERARGLDSAEDLASPGDVPLRPGAPVRRVLIVAARRGPVAVCAPARRARVRRRLRAPRASAARALPVAACSAPADAYLVRRGTGQHDRRRLSLVHRLGARHLHRAARPLPRRAAALDEARRDPARVGRHRLARACCRTASPTTATSPEFNSVDASLWFVVAVHESARWPRARHRPVVTAAATARRARAAPCDAILDGYAARHALTASGIDADGLLAAGEPGVQLTWMDAKVGDWVVTPRIGKPVEVQALWLNALRHRRPRCDAALARGRSRAAGARSRERFWNEDDGLPLRRGRRRPRARRRRRRRSGPTRSSRVGGLPFPLLEGARARAVLDAVEARLWTPLGLRSLAPGEPGYAPRYAAACRERDGAYHQGTVWPWLLGPFVEAWVRVRGDTAERTRARRASASSRRCSRHLDERRARPRLGDRRRRRAAPPRRLPVPGLVGRRSAAPRAARQRVAAGL